MAKKSKLTEKPTRITTSLEEKLKVDLKKYNEEITVTNMETARSLRFSMLLRDWFEDARPTFIEEYLKGIEKYVKVRKKDFIMRGRIDALYGNAVIEFEGDLKKKLREAQRQLREYVFGLLSDKKEREISYLCIATDGVLFYVYTPRWKNQDELPKTLEDIELKEIERTNFSTLNANDAFLWLDRYFFRKSLLHPTTENFVRDFGINSAAYNFAIKLLEIEWKRIGNKSEFKVIYENWAKYLRIAYGTSVADTELFLRHTYLASFAKLLAYMRLTDKGTILTATEIVDIFTGKYFQKRGMQNFLEEDFLSWIAREKVRATLVELTKRISTLLDKYYLQEISEDVLKSLYQELVDPETRHDLGEFYTPDWLADRVVSKVLEKKPSASVLDPSCGSGSFLYFAIRFKRKMLGDSEKTLHHIRDNVVGVDIHPLAVIIAKTNYILALGDLVKTRVKDFHIPVYMADSLRLPEQQGQIRTVEKVPSIRVELDHHEALIPDIFISTPTAYDEAIETCHKFAEHQRSSGSDKNKFIKYAKSKITEVKCDDVSLEVLWTVAERMQHLIENERNSIWTYILKNVYKPIFLKRKFDWIIGNPPWLSYRYVEKGKYQEFLRDKILNEYCLLAKGGGHLITHLELGTLFFCACLYEYGMKENAEVAFVLPRSVFTSDQHNNFRKTSFIKSGSIASIYQIGITEVWDLEKVTPLFNVPACVVFGKRPHYTKKPIQTEIISGQLPGRNTPLNEANNYLEVKKSALYVVQQGDRSFWSEDPKAELVGRSPYGSKFAEGATIVPRSCWFVEFVSDTQTGINPSKPYVRTDPRATEQAKEAYVSLKMEGNIESEFLYATLLSTDLLPFGFLNYRPVVLPIKPSGDNFIMVNAERARRENYHHLGQWLEECEKEWKVRRGKEKAQNMNIYQRLDHVHGLTQQNYTAKYKIIYPSSSTNLCSAVAPNEKISITIEGQKIILQNFVAESKTYYFETENKNEAHYLSAFLNSPTIDELIKPMQSKGLWGPRDIHKKVWELPIPAYNESKSTHRELAELGIECAEKVKNFLPELATKDITPGKIGRLRNQVRERLEKELSEIDEIVKGIMKK